MIKKRGNSWWGVVYAGRDPLTGRKRQKTGTAATKAEARQLEARLISQVGAGQHGGAAGKTVANLIVEGGRFSRPCGPGAHSRAVSENQLAAWMLLAMVAADMRQVRADSKKEISSLAMGSGSSSGAK